MEQLTLQQLFGVNVIETSQTLVIKKSDLPLLTPTVNNTSESLLTGILLKALENFQGNITNEQGQPITDESNNPITYDNKEFFEGIEMFLWGSYFESRASLTVIRTQIILHSYTLDDTD